MKNAEEVLKMSKYRIYSEGDNSIMTDMESARFLNYLTLEDLMELLNDKLHGVRLVEGGDEDG